MLSYIFLLILFYQGSVCETLTNDYSIDKVKSETEDYNVSLVEVQGSIEDDDDENSERNIIVVEANLTKILDMVIQSYDPLFIDSFTGALPTITYNLADVSVKGFKNCTIQKLNSTLDLSVINIELHCKYFSIVGFYDVVGYLVTMPIEGKGNFEVTTGNYTIIITAAMKKAKSKKGIVHLKFKDFTLNMVAQSPIKFAIHNLFGGNQHLADPVVAYANNNSKAVADLTQEPFGYYCMKRILKNANKLLKPLPISQLIIN